MFLKTLNARHIRLISLYWTRQTLRGGSGLVFLMIALLFGLSVAQIIITPVEKIIEEQKKYTASTDTAEIIETINKIGIPVVEWVLGLKSSEELSASNQPNHQWDSQSRPEPHPWAVFLLEQRPGLLSIIFIILLFGMPLLIAFLAFNLFSGDIQSRGLRYLLLRTERVNIFMGRFMGTVFFTTLVIAVIVITITFYVGVKIRIYPVSMLLMWGLHGFAALTILMLPYIALCAWVSAGIDSPFVSLVIAKLIIGGVILMAYLASLAWKPAFYLIYALPWGCQNYLLHPQLTHSLGAGCACMGYTVLFFALGYYRFQTRDL